MIVLMMSVMIEQGMAQNNMSEDSKLRFGLQVSPTVSWLSSDESLVKGGGANIGLKVGALGEYNFAKNYSITIGVGFGFSHGGKLQFPAGGNLLPKSDLPDVPESLRKNLPTDTKIDYRLTFIEFPVSLKLRTREFGYVKYYAEIPIINLSAVTQAKANIDAANLDVNKQKINKDVKTLNAQWGLGLGMEYNLSQDFSMVFGAYYTQGFFDLTKKYANIDDKAVDHVITFRIGALF